MERTAERDWEKHKNTIIPAAFQMMLEHTQDMVFVKDMNLVYVAASPPFVRMVGKHSAEEIIGRTDFEIFEDQSLARRYVADDHKLLEQAEKLVDYIEPLTDNQGQARYGSTSKFILYGIGGERIGILGVTKDITRDYVARQHYQQELQYLFELPADTYAVSYLDVDSWRIVGQRRQMIGQGTMQACHTVEQLCEAALESIKDKTCEAANFYRNFTPLVLKEIYASGRSELDFKYQRYLSDGSIRWVHNHVRFLVDVDSSHLCAMLSAKDIDAEKREVQELAEAARMDQMTRLLNRETTMEYIRQSLREESNHSHVLFMMDVDNFKSLNDTLGHQAGDEFLIALTGEIKKCFRETDVVGRIGGDEFFVWMKNVSSISSVTWKAKEVFAVIHKVCSAYPEISLSGSMGISVYPENGRTLEELYAQADGALYEAKHLGKNRFVFA